MQLEALQELTLWISSERDQVDARIAKSLQIGRARIQGTLSFFNLFNASTSLTLNNRFQYDDPVAAAHPDSPIQARQGWSPG